MLSRAHRGLKRADFSAVYKSGKTLKIAFFRIKTVDNPENTVQVAVVVANKTLKGAVKRNKLRRQVYAIMREIQPLFIKNARIVIIPEQSAKTADFQAIQADLIQGFTKIQFLDSEKMTNISKNEI